MYKGVEATTALKEWGAEAREDPDLVPLVMSCID